jgi:hypothetical protein
MRFKKAPKRIVELNREEVRLLWNALMQFRNKCINARKPTEDIETLLLMLK